MTIKRLPMKLNRAPRAAAVISVLLGGLTIAAFGPLAGTASADTSPAISVTSPPPYTSWSVSGSGFTPGGTVLVQEKEDSGAVVSSATVTASRSVLRCQHFPEEPPECSQYGGGLFSTTLPLAVPVWELNCGQFYYGSVIATDLTTGIVASEPWEELGFCPN
jgi:hypothetical protein